MFTGLVEEVGMVRRLERRGSGGRLSIRAKQVLEGTRIGDSIAVSGACLTVVELGGDGFVVDCMPETLLHTTLAMAVAGMPVNLERSLALGGRLGGHLVLGHVDEVVQVLKVNEQAASLELWISLPETVRACVAARGSIAVDGISLTVTRLDATGFGVGVIPHTLRETTLQNAKPGLRVNLEADVLARYVLRTLQAQAEGKGAGPGLQQRAGGGLSEELLRGQGFA